MAGPPVAELAASLLDQMLPMLKAAGHIVVASDADVGEPHPLDRYLDEVLNRLRDAAQAGDPKESLRRFEEFLETLPETASGVIRFRAKGNIGHRHLALGDGPTAGRWLVEAYDEAPTDPRAIANKVLGLWLGGDAEAAYAWGLERLAEDPTNETLASYLPQVAVMVPGIEDPLAGIPPALLDNEMLRVAEAVFWRGRDVTPQWWACARRGAELFPASSHLLLLRAFADLDEITRNEDLQRFQIPTEAQREGLGASVAVLDAYWMDRPHALRSPFDEASHALACAMIAHQILQDGDKAIERATRIADLGLTETQVLANAVQVAFAWHRMDLARRLVGLAPDDPDLAFHAAVIAVQDGDWDLAVRRFAVANVPKQERVMVDTVTALARIKAGADDAPTLDAVRETAGESPRALVLVARIATDIGEADLARLIYRQAVESVDGDSHIATRLMVASLAEEIGTPSDVIDLLDRRLPVHGYPREHAWLAVAHANERPHRRRNLAFFERLTPEARRRHEIARAHASVLLDVGKVAEALGLLRRLHDEEIGDAYVSLRLVDALRRSGDGRGADRVLRTVPLDQARGAPESIMMLARAVDANGEPERAYRAAYELVRKHPDRPDLALNYVGLGFMRNGENPCFRKSVAGLDASVTIEGPGGAARTFVIDAGPEFYGIPVEVPTGPAARLVEGKRSGDTFEVPRAGADPEIWTVREVGSKFLHLHHRILEEFGSRYAGAGGLARFTTNEGDISEVLAVVRRTSEINRSNAQFYLDGQGPLVVVARMLGGDPVSFAQYSRGLGGEIATCLGSAQERDAALALATGSEGRGIVLDPYTAWVSAEMGILSALADWFGTLHVPHSALSMIDRLLDQERGKLGQQQMSVSWVDGTFYRQEADDEHTRAQIALLEAGRAKIADACSVHHVLLPDEIGEAATKMLEMAGARFLDAAFLARERDVPLMSDDLHYRAWAGLATGCTGLWLQPALMRMVDRGRIEPSAYATALVGLAARKHGHVSFTGGALFEICRQDDAKLSGFRAALGYIGGRTADMPSHLVVVSELLQFLWEPGADVSPLRCRAATGMLFEALLRHRSRDWSEWLVRMIRYAPRTIAARRYIHGWLRGHFIAIDVLDTSARRTRGLVQAAE